MFALNPQGRPSLKLLGGRLPVLVVDHLFQQPEVIRAEALALPFGPPGNPYPGKIAKPPPSDDSLEIFLRSVLSLVNGEYLPRVPPIVANNQQITSFGRVETDFAIIDVHPDELTPTQRRPHVDPVPIFGLVYLDPHERGGTLFFDAPPATTGSAGQRNGYCSADDSDFPLVGRIEGAFNRLAIYPGFVLHSAEISGSWIENEERFNAPRLTQRLVFFP